MNSGRLGNRRIYGRGCLARDIRGSWCDWKSRSKYLHIELAIKYILWVVLLFYFDAFFLIVISLFWIFLQFGLGKWLYKSKSRPIIHEAYMFPLLVKKQLDLWPEKSFRKRRWVCIKYNMLLQLLNDIVLENCPCPNFSIFWII